MAQPTTSSSANGSATTNGHADAKQSSTASQQQQQQPPQHNLLLTASYVLLFVFWGASNFILIPVSLNLIVTSSLIIYIGSHRSLRLLVTEDEGGVPAAQKEILSAQDAYKFPFIGSAALFGLYLAFKYLDKDKINLLLAVYFSLAGVFTLTSTISPFLFRFIRNPKRFGFKTNLPLLGEIDCMFTVAEIVAIIISSIFSWQYVKTKHFLMNNVLSISFCIQTIERMSIGSYKVGAVLLVGLFFYDIFWVFGTDVMVSYLFLRCSIIFLGADRLFDDD
jgi:minor histocompatibility antigen H13